ncbi:MAG TPA: hypothetical protein VGS41_09150, partial [Chthonomonadales bacterium]|nr:hypothetical protein [Chthonomonadales bacterium]
MSLSPHEVTSVVAAFLASIVEFVEALTIVLAVGAVRGWRPAMYGVLGGVLFLVALVAVFGPALQKIPIDLLRFVVGSLLLLFGVRWLRKAILRAAGVLQLHDEEAAYARETDALRGGARARPGIDLVAVATTFKAVTLEGLEVVFIVIATGAMAHMLLPASAGALAAGIVVIALGVALHRPLARVPENALKFAVGVLLSSFGAFWSGEGMHLSWPGEDLAIPALIGGFAILS